jgi:integrase
MGTGRQGSGVEIRETSIRLSFYYQGKRYKETLFGGEAPLPPTPANIKYAGRVASEIRAKIRNGEFRFAEYFPHSEHAKQDDPDSLGAFMDHWHGQLSLKGSTTTTYRRMKDNFWKPHLGDRRITAIKHSDITTVLKKGGWKSGKTRNNYLSMLSSVFELAVADGLVAKNPCDSIEQASWQKAPPDPFTPEEANLILSSMQEHYPEPVLNFYEFMFFSGLRTGEGIGLEWTEVDFPSKTVLVKQGFVVDEMSDTKTSKARTVNLNSRALAALKRQKAWTYLHKSGRVFLDPGTGEPWAYEQNARKRYWKPTLKRLGIRYRRPYNTRHTCATMGLMAGVNPAYMAAQLGHSLEVFLRDYSKWINGDQDAREMAKIEEQIRQMAPEQPLKKKKAP